MINNTLTRYVEFFVPYNHRVVFFFLRWNTLLSRLNCISLGKGLAHTFHRTSRELKHYENRINITWRQYSSFTRVSKRSYLTYIIERLITKKCLKVRLQYLAGIENILVGTYVKFFKYCIINVTSIPPIPPCIYVCRRRMALCSRKTLIWKQTCLPSPGYDMSEGYTYWNLCNDLTRKTFCSLPSLSTPPITISDILAKWACCN